MELREAFDIADTDKGGALELDEVSVINTMILNIIVYFCIWRHYWKRNELKITQTVIYEN